MSFNLDFAHAQGQPTQTATFRKLAEDFIVDEQLGFEFSGEGEHLYVQIKKTGENTQYVAKQLARYLGIKPVAVGFSGLKDRHAVTTQWFSVQLPGKNIDIDWADFIEKTQLNVEVLQQGRHSAKLRRGQHLCNDFVITLRDISQSDDLEARLQTVAANGAPNYFGEQRFGIDGGNLARAQAWFSGEDPIRNKNMQGIILSAARSYLFNLVLSERIKQDNWLAPMDGDPAEVPTGPLWGRGRPKSTDALLELENEVLAHLDLWRDKLEHNGLSQERRDLVLKPRSFSWQWQDNALVLSLSLAPGLYATSLLRDVLLLNNVSAEQYTPPAA